MYLKQRNRRTILFGLLAALFLTLGVAASGWKQQFAVMAAFESTEFSPEQETTPAQLSTDFSSVTSDGNSASGTSSGTPDDSSASGNSSEAPGESSASEYPAAADRKRSLPPFVTADSTRFLTWAGILGFCFGLIFCVPFLFLLRQSEALLGPEPALACCFLCLRLFTLSDRISGWLPQTAAWWLLILFFLICLRELVGWLWKGGRISWSCFHRFGLFLVRRTGRQRFYLMVLITVCTAGAVCGIYDFYLGGRFLFLGIEGIFTTLLCFLCIWRLTGQIEHLSQQVTRLHEGLAVTPGNGLFETTEQELADLVNQRDEAVKNAVSSERFKVELISNVSHDLRTPLTAILGYGELLEQENGMSEEGKRRLLLLNQKAGYMRDLVESLFELTKVSSGAEKSRMQEIDLLRLLEQTFGLFDDRLQAAGLQVRRHYPGKRLPIVTDGARMHQVFANLVGNAIKYALPNSRIHVEVRPEDSFCQIRMTNVASYEMDFSPEEIVERFAKGDKARNTQGSGIGLAIAQTYTESVGGNFHVEIDGEQFSAIVRLPIEGKSDPDA